MQAREHTLEDNNATDPAVTLEDMELSLFDESDSSTAIPEEDLDLDFDIITELQALTPEEITEFYLLPKIIDLGNQGRGRDDVREKKLELASSDRLAQQLLLAYINLNGYSYTNLTIENRETFHAESIDVDADPFAALRQLQKISKVVSEDLKIAICAHMGRLLCFDLQAAYYAEGERRFTTSLYNEHLSIALDDWDSQFKERYAIPGLKLLTACALHKNANALHTLGEVCLQNSDNAEALRYFQAAWDYGHPFALISCLEKDLISLTSKEAIEAIRLTILRYAEHQKILNDQKNNDPLKVIYAVNFWNQDFQREGYGKVLKFYQQITEENIFLKLKIYLLHLENTSKNNDEQIYQDCLRQYNILFNLITGGKFADEHLHFAIIDCLNISKPEKCGSGYLDCLEAFRDFLLGPKGERYPSEELTPAKKSSLVTFLREQLESAEYMFEFLGNSRSTTKSFVEFVGSCIDAFKINDQHVVQNCDLDWNNPRNLSSYKRMLATLPESMIETKSSVDSNHRALASSYRLLDQSELAYMYLNGYSYKKRLKEESSIISYKILKVPSDFNKALRKFKNILEVVDSDTPGIEYLQAQVGILLYYMGKRDSQYQRATSYLEKAAQRNNANALYYLGVIAKRRKIKTTATAYFKAAADQGHLNAFLQMLGFMSNNQYCFIAVDHHSVEGIELFIKFFQLYYEYTWILDNPDQLDDQQKQLLQKLALNNWDRSRLQKSYRKAMESLKHVIAENPFIHANLYVRAERAASAYADLEKDRALSGEYGCFTHYRNLIKMLHNVEDEPSLVAFTDYLQESIRRYDSNLTFFTCVDEYQEHLKKILNIFCLNESSGPNLILAKQRLLGYLDAAELLDRILIRSRSQTNSNPAQQHIAKQLLVSEQTNNIDKLGVLHEKLDRFLQRTSIDGIILFLQQNEIFFQHTPMGYLQRFLEQNTLPSQDQTRTRRSVTASSVLLNNEAKTNLREENFRTRIVYELAQDSITWLERNYFTRTKDLEQRYNGLRSKQAAIKLEKPIQRGILSLLKRIAQHLEYLQSVQMVSCPELEYEYYRT